MTTAGRIDVAPLTVETPWAVRARRRPSLAVKAAFVMTTLAAAAAVLAPSGWAVPLDTAQQVITIGCAAIALVALWRVAPAGHRWLVGGLGIALLLSGAGASVWALRPVGAGSIGLAAVLLVAGLCVVVGVLFRSFMADLDRTRPGQIVIDGSIVVVSTACLLVAAWDVYVGVSGVVPIVAIAGMVGIAVVAGPMAAYLALLDRRVQPGVWGPWAVLQGLGVGGLAWISWLATLVRGEPSPVSPIHWGFSIAVILVTWGGVTWDRAPARSRRYERWAAFVTDAFPLAAVAGCVALALFLRGRTAAGVVEAGASLVVGLVLVRQWLLILEGRRALHRERELDARLSREAHHRAEVLTTLALLDVAPTPAETARRICERAVSLEGVEQAAVLIFEPDGTATILAEAGPARTLLVAGDTQSAATASYLRDCLERGPWFESIATMRDRHALALAGAGITMLANAPISAGDRVVGMMSLGTTDEGNQAIYEERLASSREFGVVAGALLAAALEARASEREDHAALTRLIAEEAFHPVFQPIVDLGSRKTVGFEALTRFADGVRPDVRFEAADRVGLGTELEWATLDAATRDADALPEGAYLSLNVSPAVVADVERVVGLVARGPRPVVLEVTEHAAVANYATLCEALVTLRGFARIAVDDVGAGYAGLRHILEIRPDILKLDIGLVRAVDEDAAKRALIGSIVAFSRETGSVVLAEGIETDAESQTLLALGVELGQGYLFGRPERVTTVR